MIFYETRLPEALKQIRGKVSQARFSAQLDVKQTTYSSWETGKKEPSLGTIAGLARHFGVTTDYLLGLSPVPTPVSVSATGGSAVAVDHSTAAVSPADASAELARLRGEVAALDRTVRELLDRLAQK